MIRWKNVVFGMLSLFSPGLGQDTDFGILDFGVLDQLVQETTTAAVSVILAIPLILVFEIQLNYIVKTKVKTVLDFVFETS